VEEFVIYRKIGAKRPSALLRADVVPPVIRIRTRVRDTARHEKTDDGKEDAYALDGVREAPEALLLAGSVRE
jgi:hypothetical protein